MWEEVIREIELKNNISKVFIFFIINNNFMRKSYWSFKMNIKKIADEVLSKELINKQAADYHQLFNEFNEKFNNYIKKDFKSVKLNKMVPYVALPVSEKQLVWRDFWDTNDVKQILQKQIQTEEKEELK